MSWRRCGAKHRVGYSRPKRFRAVDFQLTPEQQRLQNKCRELAADFATRSATHDRDASHPIENYNRLREEGFLALTVGKEWGGSGASFLDHTIRLRGVGPGLPIDCPGLQHACLGHHAPAGKC